ncbi:MAG TPA: FHA domain-containing protein [Gemmataceae bacterium]|nr:FHA domain-containing protein [Gemmataceae bacterium]
MEFSRACGLSGPMRITVRSDTGEDEGSFSLDQPFALIGRGRLRDIRHDSPGVSERHAYLQVVAGRVFCVDLGSRTGVRWGDTARTTGWLELGTDIRIGGFILQTEFAADPTGSASGSAELMAVEVKQPGGTPLLTPLCDPVTLVGRASPCALRGIDPGLASYHCALVNARGDLWLVDLRSGKGTKVNGRPVRLGRLKDGDLLQAGRWAAVVRRAPGPSDDRALVPTPAAAAADPTPAMIAQSVAMAFAPFRQIMDQFQQCVLMMGQMFTTMQQEHTAMVRDQIAQLHDLARELRDRHGDAALPWAQELTIPWADAAPNEFAAIPPSGAELPVPRIVKNVDVERLQEAHEWFARRLAETGGK